MDAHRLGWRRKIQPSPPVPLTAGPPEEPSMTRAVNRPRPAAAPRIALLALALACLAEPAAAQRPTSKQINAIRQACRADYQSHCASVPTGGQASVNCLEENYAKLSAPCQKSLSVLG